MTYAGIGRKGVFGLDMVGAAVAAGISGFITYQQLKDACNPSADEVLVPKINVPESQTEGEIIVQRGLTPRSIDYNMLRYDSFDNLFGSIIPDEASLGLYQWKLVDISGQLLTKCFSDFIPSGYSVGSIDHLTPLAKNPPTLCTYQYDYINPTTQEHTGIPISSTNYIIAPGVLLTEQFQNAGCYNIGPTNVDLTVAPSLRCDWTGQELSIGQVGSSMRTYRLAVDLIRPGSRNLDLSETFFDGTYLLVVRRLNFT